MTCLNGLALPGIIPAIGVSDRCSDKLGRRRVVKRRQGHRYVIAADLRDVAVPERSDAASLAEEVVDTLGCELVVDKHAFACEESKGGGLNDDAPIPGFAANGAVALGGTRSKIDISFVAHGAAMAAPVIGPQHSSAPSSFSTKAVYA
jgi:hypothetical protein